MKCLLIFVFVLVVVSVVYVELWGYVDGCGVVYFVLVLFDGSYSLVMGMLYVDFGCVFGKFDGS